jgi:hypothetical protein
MEMPQSLPDQGKFTTYFKLQRVFLAMCIALFPLALMLYVFSWPINSEPVTASLRAGITGNLFHFIAALATSLFLPLGYLAMALPGFRREPVLARIAALLGLVGWIPWSAMMAIDDLAYQVALTGSNPANVALWTRFNGDPVMLIYLVWYALGHLVSTIVIAYLAGKIQLIPRWAAWSFALTSPLTVAYFIIHATGVKYILLTLLCAGFLLGALPAAYAVFTGKFAGKASQELA